MLSNSLLAFLLTGSWFYYRYPLAYLATAVRGSSIFVLLLFTQCTIPLLSFARFFLNEASMPKVRLVMPTCS